MLNLSNTQFFTLVAIAAGIAYLVTTKGAAAVDPTSRDNIFYKGVNAVGDVLNDGEIDGDFNLGEAIYNATH